MFKKLTDDYYPIDYNLGAWKVPVCIDATCRNVLEIPPNLYKKVIGKQSVHYCNNNEEFFPNYIPT